MSATIWPLLPPIIAIALAFAIFGDSASNMLVITVAAARSGAVCGDHVSPISDTTILASAGGQRNHTDHVSTQMPYALIVAACCFVGYIVAGLTGNGWLGLATGFVLLVALAVFVFEKCTPKKRPKPSRPPMQRCVGGRFFSRDGANPHAFC